MMLSGEAAVRWISKNEQISTVGTVVDSWFFIIQGLVIF